MTTEVYARIADAGEELVGAVPARTVFECETPGGASAHVAFETLRAALLGGGITGFGEILLGDEAGAADAAVLLPALLRQLEVNLRLATLAMSAARQARLAAASPAAAGLVAANGPRPIIYEP